MIRATKGCAQTGVNHFTRAVGKLNGQFDHLDSLNSMKTFLTGGNHNCRPNKNKFSHSPVDRRNDSEAHCRCRDPQSFHFGNFFTLPKGSNGLSFDLQTETQKSKSGAAQSQSKGFPSQRRFGNKADCQLDISTTSAQV